MTADPTLDEFLGTQTPAPARRRRLLLLGIAALVTVLVAAMVIFGSGSGSPSYATEEVTRGDLQVTVSATGNLAPTNEVEVGSEVSGLVEHVYVDVNDRVVRGQVLARLDTSRLADSVNKSRAQLAAAAAGVAQAQAALSLANANLARQQTVYRVSGGKVPSATELDAARSQVAQAAAQVRSAQAQVAQARAQLQSDQTNLSKASVVSPVTGVVLSRDIEPGQTVAASFNTPQLFVIAEDLTRMKLEAAVDEADIGQVRAGQAAAFTVDAFPGQKFPAVIERVNLGASSSSSSTGSSASSSTVISYTAVLKVDNAKLTLRPGLTATAQIVTAERKNVLLVPNSALRFTPPAEQQNSGLMSAMGPGRMFRQSEKSAKVERGSEATIYSLDAEGALKPITVVVGESDGKKTAVSGKELSAGMSVVTGTLADSTS